MLTEKQTILHTHLCLQQYCCHGHLTFREDRSPRSDIQIQGGAEGEGPELRHRGSEQQNQQQAQEGWACSLAFHICHTDLRPNTASTEHSLSLKRERLNLCRRRQEPGVSQSTTSHFLRPSKVHAHHFNLVKEMSDYSL